ncbi:zinc finger protein 420 [Diorhabda sublineata]|uniref:zinc finger protein 420 n=1 Tax=Diorhabda sublineata TaxID=1163346 RepID=UPI0024E06D27|nr:zinc finger protein 420 [Diorhabda sublineata]
MDSINIVCPVCTLYLRPGITLKQHLTSHPKQKVIEALVKLSGTEDEPKVQQNTTSVPITPQVQPAGTSQVNSTIVNQSWNQPAPVQVGSPSNANPLHGNHVFIYQQSMSTTSPQPNVLQVNHPLSQQYVYHPAIFNPQMMPYVYQQQQVILSSNSLHPQVRALPLEPPTSNSEIQPEAVVPETHNDKENNSEARKESIDLTVKEAVNEPISQVLTKEDIEGLHHELDIKTIKHFEEDQSQANDIPPEEFQEVESGSEEECNQESENLDREDLGEAFNSSNHTDWKTDSELSKACQTQNGISTSPEPQIETGTQQPSYVNQLEYFYPPNNDYPENFHHEESNNVSMPFTTNQKESYEQSEPIYTSANILHGNDIDFVNLEDIVLIGDFTTNGVASQVEHFEHTIQDRPGVLMTIGDIPEPQKVEYQEHRDFEESMSRGSSHVNIRADEKMPARGELSGQESIGGNSDITWNRLQYQEGSSRMSHSYEMIGRETWEQSESESVYNTMVKRQNSTQVSCEHNDYDNDVPTIISYIGPSLNFKCSTCGESFESSKDRSQHESEKHPEKARKNKIGSEIGKKSVKKLIIKPKTEKPKEEPNFDNVFTNKFKQENPTETQTDIVALESTVKIDDEPLQLPKIKTLCSLCDCVFDNVKSLRQHRLEVHKDHTGIRHKCLTCGEYFPTEYTYTDHLKIHPLECRLCGKLFYRRHNMKLHMKRHLGLKPYKCDLCDKSFVTRQKHDEHKNVHTGDAPIKCNLCDEKFRRHSNLVQHRNRHHFQLKKKVKDYICHCGEIFHSKKKLAWHKEIHDPKPKACSQCNEKFLHMSSLTRHMRRAHNDKFLPEENRQNENVECPICKGVYLKSSLDVHIKNHSGTRPYTCLMCNKDFTTKWNLKLHKWTHASRTTKPYKCDQCKGAFIRESDYIAHMNSHKSVRPYTCNYCGAQFIRKYNCLRHVKEHENDKTFSCTVCGKSFHRSYYLKDHMRVHSGVRPYTCHICGKTSSTKSNHNKHVQIHHAREPVSTEN